MPTLPKIIRPVTRNTLIFYLALVSYQIKLPLCSVVTGVQDILRPRSRINVIAALFLISSLAKLDIFKLSKF